MMVVHRRRGRPSRLDVDVVLLDLSLPRVSGLNVLGALPSLSADAQFGRDYEVEPPGLSTGTLSRMTAYAWPGNVRELENFVERSVVMYPGAESFPFDVERRAPSS